MPGLVGYSRSLESSARSSCILSEMIRAARHQPWYQVSEMETRVGSFGCIHLGTFPHPLTAKSGDGRVGVLLDGWLADNLSWKNRRPELSGAEFILREFLERGISFVKELNGQFNLLIWDEREDAVYIANDRYGLRPLQYLWKNGELFFAPEGKALLAGSGVPAQLNLDTVIGYFSLGRLFVGDETFFQDVEVLAPATILRAHRGKLEALPYWDYHYDSVENIDDTFVEELVECFVAATRRYTTHPLRYGLSLSGGLDSRSLLKAANNASVNQLRTYTWGMDEPNDENDIAQQVAARLNVPFQKVPLVPNAFLVDAPQGVEWTEGLDLCVQSYASSVYPQIRRHTDVLLTGLALDVSLGGSYLTPDLIEKELTPAQAREKVLRPMSYFSAEQCKGLVRLPDIDERLARKWKQIEIEWDSGKNVHPADQSDRFLLRYRGRVLFMRQNFQRFFVEDVSPTFDNEFIDMILKIPPALRQGHAIYRRFLSKLAPELMDIPYQRTLLPPSSPQEFWLVGARIEAEREKLLRAVWHATNGKVFVPYRRYCTNYDEWLRIDPDWIRVVNDLLLSDESRSCAMFLNPEWVHKLIAEHREGQTTHHHRIINLMTLELFLRQFFK